LLKSNRKSTNAPSSSSNDQEAKSQSATKSAKPASTEAARLTANHDDAGSTARDRAEERIHADTHSEDVEDGDWLLLWE